MSKNNKNIESEDVKLTAWEYADRRKDNGKAIGPRDLAGIAEYVMTTNKRIGEDKKGKQNYLTPCIEGDTGVGKTTSMANTLKKMNIPHVMVHVATKLASPESFVKAFKDGTVKEYMEYRKFLEGGNFKAETFENLDPNKYMNYDIVPEFIFEAAALANKHGRCVIILDDFNRLSARSLFNMIMSLIYDHTIGDYHLHPGISFMLSANPGDDFQYDGAMEFDAAVRDRLTMFDYITTTGDWIDYIQAHVEVTSNIASFLTFVNRNNDFWDGVVLPGNNKHRYNCYARARTEVIKIIEANDFNCLNPTHRKILSTHMAAKGLPAAIYAKFDAYFTNLERFTLETKDGKREYISEAMILEHYEKYRPEFAKFLNDENNTNLDVFLFLADKIIIAMTNPNMEKVPDIWIQNIVRYVEDGFIDAMVNMFIYQIENRCKDPRINKDRCLYMTPSIQAKVVRNTQRPK